MITKKKPTLTPSSCLEPHGRITLITFLVLLTLVLVLSGVMVFSYLLSLAAGAMLALLSYPLYKKLRKRGVSAGISSSVLTVGIILLIVIPLSIFLFLAINQGIAIAKVIGGAEGFSAHELFDQLTHWGPIEKAFGSPDDLKRQIREWIQSFGSATLGTVVGVAAYIPNILLQLILSLISYFYFLLDGPRFIIWVSDKIPLDADVRKKVSNSFVETTIFVIWATLAAAAVQAAIMFAAFLILSVPAVFLAATATFIFAWIPIVGSTPIWVAGAIYLYSQDSIVGMILMLLFGIITSLADNFVRPLILKGKANIHPLVSLVAIFGGIGMFGIMGVFVGPIIAAVLISLLQIWPEIGQRFGFMSSDP